MNITCDIIRDILPLYAEDMVSRDTKELAQEHLARCESCRRELDGICTAMAVPVEVEPGALEQVERGIRRRVLLTAATAVLVVLTILAGVFVYLTVPVWLRAEEAISRVEPLEDGLMKIWYTPEMSGRTIIEQDGYVFYFCYSLRYRQAFYRELPEGMNEASYEGYDIVGPETVNGEISVRPAERSHWYLDINDLTAGTLLWDAGHTRPEEPILYGTWILGWLCIGAAGAAVVLGALYVVLRRVQWRNVLGGAAALCCCWVAASALVTGFRFMSNFDILLKLVYIMVMTGLVFGTWMCAAALRRNP